MTRKQFSSQEIYSVFAPSEPPPNAETFLPVFMAECQAPLDQSLFKPKSFRNQKPSFPPGKTNKNMSFQPQPIQQPPAPPITPNPKSNAMQNIPNVSPTNTSPIDNPAQTQSFNPTNIINNNNNNNNTNTANNNYGNNSNQITEQNYTYNGPNDQFMIGTQQNNNQYVPNLAPTPQNAPVFNQNIISQPYQLNGNIGMVQQQQQAPTLYPNMQPVQIQQIPIYLPGQQIQQQQQQRVSQFTPALLPAAQPPLFQPQFQPQQQQFQPQQQQFQPQQQQFQPQQQQFQPQQQQFQPQPQQQQFQPQQQQQQFQPQPQQQQFQPQQQQFQPQQQQQQFQPQQQQQQFQPQLQQQQFQPQQQQFQPQQQQQQFQPQLQQQQFQPQQPQFQPQQQQFQPQQPQFQPQQQQFQPQQQQFQQQQFQPLPAMANLAPTQNQIDQQQEALKLVLIPAATNLQPKEQKQEPQQQQTVKANEQSDDQVPIVPIAFESKKPLFKPQAEEIIKQQQTEQQQQQQKDVFVLKLLPPETKHSKEPKEQSDAVRWISDEPENSDENENDEQQPQASTSIKWDAPQPQPKVPSVASLLAAEEAKKRRNQPPEKTANLPKPSNKANKVVMSFQDLQRQMNKPAQWDALPVTTSSTPSMDKIIKSASPSSNTNSTSSNSSGFPKGKGKGKATTMSLQEFNRQGENEGKNDQITSKKPLNVPSMNALIESEKNTLSRPPPTTAPVAKRNNHRGRGKEIIDPATYGQPPPNTSPWGEHSEQKASAPSFNAIASSESKSKPKTQQQQAITTTSTNPAVTAKKNKKAKAQVMSLQEFNRPPPSAASGSAWGDNNASSSASSSSKNSKTKSISFTDIEKAQGNKNSNSNNSNVQPSAKTAAVAASTSGSAAKSGNGANAVNSVTADSTKANNGPEQQVQMKQQFGGKKKKAMRMPLDEFLKSQTMANSQTSQNWASPSASTTTTKGARFNDLYKDEVRNRPKPKEPSSDDDNYPLIGGYGTRPSSFNPESAANGKKSIVDIIRDEEKQKNKSNQQQKLGAMGLAAGKKPAASFGQLITQEKVHEEGGSAENVAIIEDSHEVRSRQRNSHKGNNQQQPPPNKKKSTEEDDLFWGATTMEDVQNMDENEFPSLTAPSKKGQRQGGQQKQQGAVEPTEFLMHLIEEAMNDYDDYYEMAEVLVRMPRKDMVKRLQSLVNSYPQATAIADKFFRRFPS